MGESMPFCHQGMIQARRRGVTIEEMKRMVIGDRRIAVTDRRRSTWKTLLTDLVTVPIPKTEPNFRVLS